VDARLAEGSLGRVDLLIDGQPLDSSPVATGRHELRVRAVDGLVVLDHLDVATTA
jgi:hypothetical protein